MKSGDFAARIRTVAAPAMLGPAIVFLLGPHTIFTTNLGEFAVGFGDLALPWLVRTTALNWLILFAVGCALSLLSERLTRVYAALLLVFGLLLWGQGNLWNADYGAVTGDDIDLTEHAWRASYELVAWAVVPLIAVVFFRPVSRVASFAALMFLGVQLGAAAFTEAQPSADTRERWADPPPAIYQFSKNDNVIHIVLDAFQSDVFAGIMQQERPQFDQQFSGFQYFRDHAATFPTTAFSMAAMLTGEEYRNHMPARQFVRDAFKQSSIFDKVSRVGYDIDAMSIVPRPTFDEWLGPEAKPNWQGSRFRIRTPFVSQQDYREISARQLLELSLFRHAPHSMKVAAVQHPETFYRVIWMDRRETLAQTRRYQASNSAAFFEHFIESMGVESSRRPVYKLIHLGIPHRPVVVDRECRFIGATRVTRRTYTEQARCAVKLVGAFLDRLKALGVYDNSVIIIASDHGTGLRPSGFNGASASLPDSRGPSTNALVTMAGAASALMLVKPRNSSGALAISSTPTSHVDLPATVLDLLNVPGAPAAGSMFRREPKQPRVRSFGMYNLRERFPGAFLTRLDVLAVKGRVNDAAGWEFQHAVWRSDLRLDARAVDIGEPSANSHVGPGWSIAQRESGDITFVRAATREARLFASLPPTASTVVVRVASPIDRRPKSVTVDVDGRNSGRLDLTGDESYRDYTINVPADAKRPSISQIGLRFQDDNDQFVFKLDRMSVR